MNEMNKARQDAENRLQEAENRLQEAEKRMQEAETQLKLAADKASAEAKVLRDRIEQVMKRAEDDELNSKAAVGASELLNNDEGDDRSISIDSNLFNITEEEALALESRLFNINEGDDQGSTPVYHSDEEDEDSTQAKAPSTVLTSAAAIRDPGAGSKVDPTVQKKLVDLAVNLASSDASQTALADQKALADKSFGTFQVPTKMPKDMFSFRPPEEAYHQLDQSPPPRVVREALLTVMGHDYEKSIRAAYRMFMEGRLPIFVVKYFMTFQGPSNSRLSDEQRFWRAFFLMEDFREDQLFALRYPAPPPSPGSVVFVLDDGRQVGGFRPLPLTDLIPPVPVPPQRVAPPARTETVAPATATEPVAPVAPPSGTQTLAPTLELPGPVSQTEPEMPPRFIAQEVPLEEFLLQAEEYIRGFGEVPCPPVHPSRLRNLQLLMVKMHTMELLDPDSATSPEEKDELTHDFENLNALVVMTQPLLRSLEKQQEDANDKEALLRRFSNKTGKKEDEKKEDERKEDERKERRKRKKEAKRKEKKEDRRKEKKEDRRKEEGKEKSKDQVPRLLKERLPPRDFIHDARDYIVELDSSLSDGTGTTPFDINNLARVCNRIAYNLDILIEPSAANSVSEALEVVRYSDDMTYLLDMGRHLLARMLTANKEKNKD